MRVTNTSNEPVKLQVHGVAWNTDGAVQIEEITDELVINPPVFNLAPGHTQYLRFGLRKPAIPLTERAFRLILDEVPPAEGTNHNGIVTLLRVSIPVFFSPQSKSEKVTWRLLQESSGWRIVSTNEGNVHLKILSLTLMDSEGKTDDLSGLAYVLPGQQREWKVNKKNEGVRPKRLYLKTIKEETEIQLEKTAP